MTITALRSSLSPFIQMAANTRRRLVHQAYEAPRPIAYKNIHQLIEEWPKISSAFDRRGYVILHPASDDHQTLLDTCRLFGTIQNHTRAVKDGVAEIRSQSLAVPGKHVISNLEFAPHTDGSYLDGIVKVGETLRRILPPKMIAIQCIEPSKEGGLSTLIDGQKIFERVSKYNKELLPMFFSRNAMTSIGKGLIVNFPIFEQLPSGNVMMRYNYDRDLYIAKYAEDAMSFFNHYYVMNPKSITTYPLQARQIILIDNHRMLHGRTAFEGNRFLKRVWIQDDERSVTMFSPGQGKENLYKTTDPGVDESYLKKYHDYLPVTLPPALHPALLLKTGICTAMFSPEANPAVAQLQKVFQLALNP